MTVTDVVVDEFEKKTQFEKLLRAILAMETATASIGLLNSSAFHC